MELFALYFNLLLLLVLFWTLNYMDIVERKSKNIIVPTIGLLSIG